MLATEYRFHGRDGLQFVYRRGTQLRGGQMSMRYVRNARRTTFRLAVVVSKKVHKSAVLRNRLRRRIYEIVRTGPAITEPYDLLLSIFSDQLVAMPQPLLRRQVEGVLRRTGAYSAGVRQVSTAHGIVRSAPSTGRV